MDDLKALEHFYTNDLRGPLSRLERRRKQILWKSLLLALGLTVANVLVFLVMEGNEKSLAAFTTVGSLVWLAYFALSEDARWANDFKTTVIPRLLNRIEPSLAYSPEGKIESRMFDATCLYEFSQMFDYDGEDLVTGMLGGVPVSFCELRVTSGSSRSGRKTRFRGMFLVAEVDVGINDPVWLLPQDYVNMRDKFGPVSHLLSGVLNRMSQRSGEEFELDDSEFMDLYSVVAEDGQTAARLLTKDLRGKLIDLRRCFGGEVRVSFQPNQIAVALSTEGGHFEPRLTKSVLSNDVARRFAEDVSHALRIVIAIQPMS